MTGRRRVSVRLTAFGLLVLSVLLVSGFFSPVVADPEVTGVAWTALATIFVIGFLWPIVALLVVRVRIVASPSDATVGTPFDTLAQLVGVAGGVDVRIFGRGHPWRTTDVPATVTVPITPLSRGRLDEVPVEVQLSGPLGIVRARRRVTVALPRTLWIAPAPRFEPWTPDLGGDGEVPGGATRAALVGDSVRSTRPYQSGDPAHLVHWPSTARSGSLVVRELEPPSRVALAIVVNLSESVEANETTTSRAAGLVRSVHALGGQVVLCTHDDAGPRVAAVMSLLEADRLLAAATAGVPGSAPGGWPVVGLSS